MYERTDKDKQRVRRARTTLMAQGKTFASAAREIGVAPSVVSCVFTGRSRSKRVRAELTRILGYDPLSDEET